MPYHQFGLPVSATNPSIKDREGNTYPLLLDTDTFDRTGEDGDIPILPLNGGDEYVGEALEGHWHKNWDSDISTFTATILGGTLRMTGVAGVAGTRGDGWINSYHPVPLLDETELVFSKEVPIDDTGVTAARDIFHDFYLTQDKDEAEGGDDDNYILFRTVVDEAGLKLQIIKKVNGSTTTLAEGFDYTMDGTKGTGNLEATIWRVVFNGKPGTSGATMTVYLKQAATLALAESATENQITGSPLDISDLAFNVGYPSYAIRTQNTTYFGTTYDSANRAASTYLRVTYPSQFNVNYDFTEADYGEGDVELWDGDPDTTGVRVYDEDHEFSGDAYIQNSLVRLQIDDGVILGTKFSYWTGAAWVLPFDTAHYFAKTSSTPLRYPYLTNVVYVSPEQVIINIRTHDSAVQNNDIYIDTQITITRGSMFFKADIIEIYPSQDFEAYYFSNTTRRFGYAGDNAIGDDDLNITGNNTTLTDSFMVVFDDAGVAALGCIYSNKQPAAQGTRFQASDGGDLVYDSVSSADVATTTIWRGISLFSNNSELFNEAEDVTLQGTASIVADGAASGGQAVEFTLINDRIRQNDTAGTQLPAGRYLKIIRIRDTNQIASDTQVSITNVTTGDFRNEQNGNQLFTVTATYAYYGLFFDITDADVTAGDVIRTEVRKITAAVNSIYVDYLLTIPIGDGENFPQDLSHGALRDITQHPRICER